MADYSIQELMIVAAAREIRDGEVVFVGMRLPITAYGVARLTHAPNAVGLFECGIVRYGPADGMLYTMGDPPNQLGAAWATGLVQVMSLLQRGRVDAGFIGGAEIDRFGNINTSYIGDIENPTIKLPGSGGAADIAAMSKRLLAIMNHEKRRLVQRVDYVTSPGYLDGGESRKKAGLDGGPAAVITDRAILRPHGPESELHLASVHEGHDVDEVRGHTGWDLKLLPELDETPPPTAEELAALHEIDKDGFWRG
ncbi:MAG: CoA-transferase subunit beta [Rhodospirillales bacterium]|nr:CoA-transferase subunit beta [Rhodospirillales bacterium]MDH3791108.1 CoA-transferase subunit beta [Rhodospirillales bacterium]MDH3909776.1 CoA-transferase subunit beta [Rhodospirillales bacterium]MDH3920219.1 CoA-transferase subunit beta [Rhodospirillales bacterium]MDH3969377.1 CoA-transferase subunit beta [Rhodospirillales bacterium]